MSVWLGDGNSLRRNLIALLVAAPWLVLACLRLFSLDSWWVPIVLVAFTPQVMVGMVLPLGAAVVLRAWWGAVVVLAAMVVLAVVVLPRGVAGDQVAASAGGRDVTVLTANLLGESADPDALVAAIRASDPDIISLQEAGPKTLAALRAAGVLASRPYLAGDPEPGTLGYFTISRWRLTPVPGSGLTRGRWPELRVAGTPILFRNMHPTPPIEPGAVPAWKANMALMPGPGGRMRVVAGDFNATVDHRAFRGVLDRGYVDAGAVTGNGFEWTWSAGPVRRLVIDHVLFPHSVRASAYRVFNLPGSDHNAVAVTLHLPRRSATP